MVIKMIPYVFAAIIISCVILNSLKVESTQVQDLTKLFNSDNFTDLSSKFSNLTPKSVDKQLCYLSSTVKLCNYYGYEGESFKVTTTDGYILTIFRCYKTINQTQPILLIHGMMDSSDTWCMNAGKLSLAYYLIESGFDVYMINCRGNKYSRAHKTLNPNLQPSKFWDFSWTQMALYDVPNTIDKILERTGAATVSCVGHSQGGSVLLAFLALLPEYNKIVKSISLLAPFTFMNEVGSPIKEVLQSFLLFSSLKNWEFVRNTRLQKHWALTLCKISNGKICNDYLNFVLGPSKDQLLDEMLPIYFCRFPAGCSVNQLVHFGQEFERKYYGPMMPCNDFLCATPPNFPLERVNSSALLFYSPTDPHTPRVNIQTLQDHLPNAPLKIRVVPEFNHIDFIWGKNAWNLVYKFIVEHISQSSN